MNGHAMNLHYTDELGQPRDLPPTDFERFLRENRDEVLAALGVTTGPLRPRFVDVERADGSMGVGAVASHTAMAQPPSANASPDATRETF